MMDAAQFGLEGRLALITGSSRGIGLALARGLARAGAQVVLNAREAKSAEQARDALAAEGFRAHAVAFDVTRAAAVRDGVARIEDTIGPLDVLVNNAGVHRRAPLETMDEEAWRAVIETNLTGVFLVSREVGCRMIARRRGKIINVCSLMSEVSRPTVSNYAASKGGLKMLTRSMAVEWGRHNVQVNGIGPGYIMTDMTRALYEDAAFDEWLRARTPAGRWGKPEELTGTVVFLASAASDYVNGQVIYVDGGLLASI
jgi:gluconate 5-dehydrogenase